MKNDKFLKHTVLHHLVKINLLHLWLSNTLHRLVPFWHSEYSDFCRFCSLIIPSTHPPPLPPSHLSSLPHSLLSFLLFCLFIFCIFLFMLPYTFICCPSSSCLHYLSLSMQNVSHHYNCICLMSISKNCYLSYVYLKLHICVQF